MYKSLLRWYGARLFIALCVFVPAAVSSGMPAEGSFADLRISRVTHAPGAVDSVLYIHLGTAVAGSRQEVRVPLEVDDQFLQTMPEAMFVIEALNEDCPLTWRRIETPEGTLLHDASFETTKIGNAVMLRITQALPISGGGRLAWLVFMTADVSEECITEVAFTQKAVRSDGIPVFATSGRVTVLPFGPRVRIASIETPPSVTWDMHAGRYVPDPCTVRVTLKNIGNENARNVKCRLVSDLERLVVVGPAEVPGVPADVPRDGGVSVVTLEFRAVASYPDSLPVWIILSFDNAPEMMSSFNLSIPKAGPVMQYGIVVPSIAVDLMNGGYTPMPFTATLTASNTGPVHAGTVTADILLPPDITLAGPDAPNACTKTITNISSSNPVGLVPWRLHHAPSLAGETDTIRIRATAPGADTVVSAVVMTFPPVNAPIAACAITAPDTLRFDAVNGRYAGNPFDIAVTCRNDGNLSMRNTAATMTLPVDMVLDDPGDSLRRTFSPVTIEPWSQGGGESVVTWRVRYTAGNASTLTRDFRIVVAGTRDNGAPIDTVEVWHRMAILPAPQALRCAVFMADSLHVKPPGTDIAPNPFTVAMRVHNDGTLPMRVMAASINDPRSDGLYVMDNFRKELNRMLAPGDSVETSWSLKLSDFNRKAAVSLTVRALDETNTEIAVCPGQLVIPVLTATLSCNDRHEYPTTLRFDPVKQDYVTRVIDMTKYFANITDTARREIRATPEPDDPDGYIEMDTTYVDWKSGAGAERHLATLQPRAEVGFTWRYRLIRSNTTDDTVRVGILYRYLCDGMPEVRGDCRDEVVIPPVVRVDANARLDAPSALALNASNTALVPEVFPVTYVTWNAGAAPVRVSEVSLNWEPSTDIGIDGNVVDKRRVINAVLDPGDTVRVTWPIRARNVFARPVVFSAVAIGDSGRAIGVAVDTLVIEGLPKPSITVVGDPSPCPGDSVRLEAGIGYRGYRWSTGDTSHVVTVGRTNNYSVIVTAWDGCTATADTRVEYQYAPDPVLITRSRNTLTALTGGNACQWLMNGWPLTGATSNLLLVTKPGVYAAILTAPGGCTTYLQPVIVDVLVGVENAATETGLEVYPEPVSGLCTVRMKDAAGRVTITVTDLLGRAVLATDQEAAAGMFTRTLNLQAVPAGVYLLRVQSGPRIVSRTIRVIR